MEATATHACTHRHSITVFLPSTMHPLTQSLLNGHNALIYGCDDHRLVALRDALVQGTRDELAAGI